MSLESLTINDLTTDCPACGGTGKDPEIARTLANNSGFGQRTIHVGPDRCRNMSCLDGKVPNEVGWTVLEFIQAYGHAQRRSIRRAGS